MGAYDEDKLEFKCELKYTKWIYIVCVTILSYIV